MTIYYPTGVNGSCFLTSDRGTRTCQHSSFHSTLGFGASFKHAFCSLYRRPYQLHVISWIPSWQRRRDVNDVSAIFNIPSDDKRHIVLNTRKVPCDQNSGAPLMISGLYGEAPLERGTFFMQGRDFTSWSIWKVILGKCVSLVCKRTQNKRAYRCI